MAPLVGYDSSDDDGDGVQHIEPVNLVSTTQTAPDDQDEGLSRVVDEPSDTQVKAPTTASHPQTPAAEPLPGTSVAEKPVAIGPSLPPAGGMEGPAYPEEMDDGLDNGQQGDQSAPSSPYTTSRGLIHNLTLPTVPNLDIPPSPPGSPSLAAAHAALTAKFDKFLELKREKGTHFNAKIADSHALKNPPLMDKLLGFVGVGTSFEDGAAQGTEQYATTLPTELWDPACFPEWAYRRQLRKAQDRIQKERGRERGEAVQFVPESS